jgi:mannose-1-phosphate guanylyltransferase
MTIAGDRSLLQSACDRIEAQTSPERTWIITSAAHVKETAKQMPQLPARQIVGEPCGRDTAACIALGAALVARRDPQAVLVVTPADHVIEPTQEFRRGIQAAEQMALEHPQALVTFGVTPTFPSTGYGYIHRGQEICVRQGVGIYKVAAFREKPTHDLAERFVASGEYFWNSGIFVWRAEAILREFTEHQPAMFEAINRIAAAWEQPDSAQVFQAEYEKLSKISIDYAIMERAREVLVLQAPFRWDDVGSWLALERMNPQDADGNTILARHAGLKTRNCVIVGESNRLLTTMNVENLLIIQDGNATLVADRKEENAIKQLVELLKQRGLEEYL